MKATFLLTSLLTLSVTRGSPVEIEKRALATIHSNCKNANQVALTFDDGGWIYQRKVADTLHAAGAKGTFFINGNNYECIYDNDRTNDLKHTFSLGHQVASHTWHHWDLSTLSFDQVHDEMWRTEQAMQRILGVSPALMRPPYGNYNNNVRTVAHARNQSMVLWDFDSGDSDGLSASASNARYTTLADKRPSNVLTLNHETYKSTAYDVLPFALKTLKAKGYKFVTVAECLGVGAYKSQGTTNKPGVRDASWNCN